LSKIASNDESSNSKAVASYSSHSISGRFSLRYLIYTITAGEKSMFVIFVYPESYISSLIKAFPHPGIKMREFVLRYGSMYYLRVDHVSSQSKSSSGL
jgi:hypothetical protein